MHRHSCASRCPAGCGMSRRGFLAAGSASVVGAMFLQGCATGGKEAGAVRPIRAMGPASTCVPTIQACFVRRKGDYGMLWPGAVYDGEAALKKIGQQITAAAKELNLKLTLREVPLYSLEEAEAWVAQAKASNADGLLVVMLDRQKHAWPSAAKAAESGIPTVVFSPIGTSFTTNTINLADKPGCVILSTDDFAQVRYGMKMLGAGARLKATRCLVIAGNRTYDAQIPDLGIGLHYVPASTFMGMYEQTPETPEVLAMADELMRHATARHGATRQDVINGIKSYVVARTLLEREKADAISMDCLGALGKTKISLPCIAWSKMNDDGIPAACEADVGAIASHALVQYLFDRPGFQQDPVGDTSLDAVIGAHCSCPTRLNGFGTRPVPYDIVHHHGMRDATARPVWKAGQRITLADVEPASKEKPTRVIIAAGTVLDNVSVPPAGGCVVSVRAKFDGNTSVLSFPGFHQLFFYGDYKKQLVQYCQLFKLQAAVA